MFNWNGARYGDSDLGLLADKSKPFGIRVEVKGVVREIKLKVGT